MTSLNRVIHLKGVVNLKEKNVLNSNVVGDTVNNDGDTVNNDGDTVLPSFLDNTVSFKLISASMVDGNNFFI